MTTVDFRADVLRHLSPEDHLKESARVVTFDTAGDDRLALYVWYYGRRYQLIPEKPEDLYRWLKLFVDDPKAALMELGFDPKVWKTTQERVVLLRKHGYLTTVDADKLLSDLDNL